MAKKRKRNYKQGIYEIVNWEKYVGTKSPRYLSSYEYHFFRFLDRHPNIIKWASETVVVKYYNPVKERNARYIVDVYIKYRDKDGSIKEELVEVKPLAHLQKPKKTKNKKKTTFDSEMQTYIQNISKWSAAKKYATERGWKFRIITEKNIFG